MDTPIYDQLGSCKENELECTRETCNNNGACCVYKSTSVQKCRCDSGYLGQHCESLTMSGSIPTMTAVVSLIFIVFAISVFMCIFCGLYYFKLCRDDKKQRVQRRSQKRKLTENLDQIEETTT